VSDRLDGKVAVVTGAARGLGRAHAIALAAAGAAVVVNDVADPAPVVDEILSRGGRAAGVVGSVADAGDARRVVDTAVSAFGRLDILVNNAGIVRSRPIVEMSDEDFDAVVAVHLRGTFLCTREALRVMRAAGRGGRIINVTSGAAFADAYPGTANYAAAKGAIVSFTRVAAAEGAERGVTCNAIAPLARTPMSSRHLAGDDDPLLDPGAVSPFVVFLASEAAARINGEIFRVARGEISRVATSLTRF